MFLAVVACVSGCRDFSHKPWVRAPGNDTAEGMKIHYSDRVVFARVKELIPDPVHKKDGVHAAKVEIVCIYKGGQLPEKITIVGAGNQNNQIPGCPVSSLVPEKTYVFYLNSKRNDYHEIEFEPLSNEGGLDPLDELTIFCGLTLTMPVGLPANDECYEPYPYCEEYEEPTPAPTTKPTTKAPKKNPETTKPDNPGHEGKEIMPEDEPGYETNPGESKSNGGKVSGSTNDNNRSSGLVASLTILTASFVLLFL